ncbi:hypothetical protein RyT2_08960 [Pseudolactococcus yaeyamensis]
MLDPEGKVNFELYQSQSFDFAVVVQEAKAVFSQFEEIDSIICPSDIHAIALLHEVQKEIEVFHKIFRLLVMMTYQ